MSEQRIKELEQQLLTADHEIIASNAQIIELEKRVKELEEAVTLIASKSSCECWEVPGMGSGLPYTWKGCKTHHSDDPNEYCLCCIAHAALK